MWNFLHTKLEECEVILQKHIYKIDKHDKVNHMVYLLLKLSDVLTNVVTNKNSNLLERI